MLIGYARVSTQDQDLTLQLDALKAAGVKPAHIFAEQASGARADRPVLADAQSRLRSGDTFVVWRLDRLGRNVRQLIDFVGELESQGVNFRSLTEGIDTTTAGGRFFFHVAAAFAQMERELLIERTRAGLLAAKMRGRVGGRKPLMTAAKLRDATRLLKKGETPKDVAAYIGVSVATLYRHIPQAASLRSPRAAKSARS